MSVEASQLVTAGALHQMQLQKRNCIIVSKKIATHPQSTPQAIPQANYERNPFIACW